MNIRFFSFSLLLFHFRMGAICFRAGGFGRNTRARAQDSGVHIFASLFQVLPRKITNASTLAKHQKPS